ncbi:MAG: SDR family oxidoreductase [Desulfobulbaceae bacterium]|nr:MAG: SDR family oxidoreductase [Desulfobulbaceae bacterium]
MTKTIMITGATSGFGKATAQLFAENGWQLIITGRRQDRLEALAKELGSEKALISCFDVRNQQEVDQAVENLPKRFSEIDVLVNNAGLALGLEMAHEANLEDWETMVDTNIKGLLYMTRKVLPIMVKQNRGHVINVGSVAGDYPYPGGNAYGATKAFVSQFTNNLIADLKGIAVRVTNIEPGLAETEFSKVRFKWDEEKADQVYQNAAPLTATDIAEAIYWAADRPPHVNINRIEIMPKCQSFAPFIIDRSE